MGKVFARIASFSVIILFLLAGKAASRHLHDELLSDGVSDGGAREQESFLHLKGMDSSEEHCELMYGFLPCSGNIRTHMFLIVIYEFLLYHGESFAGGDGRIFRVFGQNRYAALLSQLLDSLPESLILLATGLTSSKDRAQEYAVTGAGLLTGSSVLLLTLLWGLCFICARKEFYLKPDRPEPIDQGTQLLTGSDGVTHAQTDTKVMFIMRKVKTRVIKLLTGFGVVTDAETKYHALVMFFSLIPFIVILLPSVFGLSYTNEDFKIVLLVSLSVSVICLVSYFYYQTFDARIRVRRLEYAEVERKIEMHVPFYEVQALMLDREKHLMTKQKEMERKLIHPESIKSETMTRERFNGMFEEWLDETRQLMDNPYSMDSGTEYNQVAELLLEDKIKMIQLISMMMKQTLTEELGTNQDGARGESSIDNLFKLIDADGDGYIEPRELKNYIMEVNYDEILMEDEITELMMRRLDIDRSGKIDKTEFQLGVNKWLKGISVALGNRDKWSQVKNRLRNINRIAPHNQEKQSQDKNQKTDRYHQGEANAKTVEIIKAILLLAVGLIMLTFLAEPLVENVRQFSESVKIGPFYVSFILVPLATNARTAIAAIRAAKQKRHQTTSLTFSEIYHKVFMNNILGFFVLVSVIYWRGLTWHFSAEILVVVIVCIIMGLLASFKTKFPNWTLFIAFSLYPLSLVMVYLVADTFQFT